MPTLSAIYSSSYYDHTVRRWALIGSDVTELYFEALTAMCVVDPFIVSGTAGGELQLFNLRGRKITSLEVWL